MLVLDFLEEMRKVERKVETLNNCLLGNDNHEDEKVLKDMIDELEKELIQMRTRLNETHVAYTALR